MTVIEIARLFRFVREAGDNTGQRVEAIQKWGGGVKGDSWCAFLATMVLDLYFQGNSPIPRTGSVQEVYDLAKRSGYITATPTVGDLFLYLNDAGHAHHIGFVTATSPLTGFAGNTSEDGKSTNGTGAYEHGISAYVFVRYPR